MVLLIEREHAVTVPMGQLVHASTVRRLAEVVVDLKHTSTAETTVACVTPGDESRPRLWFVHDLHGSAYRIRHLARELGDDQPVWSFESPLLKGEPNRATSLDTFAARYVTDLRQAQPEGPYWLAGYSFGAACVYEMARQLRLEGEEVAFLGIVDVGPGYRGPGWHASRSPLRPWLFLPRPPARGATVSWRLRHYATMVRQSPRSTARHLMVRTGLVRLVDPLRFRRDLRRVGRVRPTLRLWYAWEEHWKLAARGWNRSATYPGRLHLFWCSESGSADATMGWAPLVGDLEIVRFDGDHMGILEPRGVTALADVLRRAIDDELGPDHRPDVDVDLDLTARTDPADDRAAARRRVPAGRTGRTR
jgi:thioesterase domain-containing protein